ncbi:MAG: hypothetical protein Q7K71_07805 [Candidatus Omnitrophota bacterium]|nr:hypothetical protein [Candidatus Omnitrophota bacterium]
MKIIQPDTQDLLAKYFTDMSKAICTVALATHFFSNITLWLRIGIFSLALVFLAIGVILMEKKGK